MLLSRLLRPSRLGVRPRFNALLRPKSTAASSVYVEAMYSRWCADPSSVDASWNDYFQQVGGAAPAVLPSGGSSGSGGGGSASDTVRATHMIRAFQAHGHEFANLDPLALRSEGLQSRDRMGLEVPATEIDYRSFGFAEADLERPLQLADFKKSAALEGLMSNADVNMDGMTTLQELLDALRTIYTGTVGVEYVHLRNLEKLNWLRLRMEQIPVPEPSKAERLHILERLTYADHFEAFLARKITATTKRFGVEGCESLIPGMKSMVDRASELGVENIVIGMPHRGRLNVLCNVMRKPLELIMKEFAGANVPESAHHMDEVEDWSQAGDVKYHLGAQMSRTYEPSGRTVHMSLLANPSHLEAVDPLVVGKAKCKMINNDDQAGDRTLPILLHGDAAMAGQGVVYETMQMSQVADYQTGGTIHIIANNQVGFTTDPWCSRSSMYCTDIGKAFECPVWHVNADDPEAVVRVFQMAIEYRQEFHTDVVIDVIGYRRYGHNEGDQPAFTQPLMYQQIGKHPPALKVYQDRLVREGHATQEEVDAISASCMQTLEAAFVNSKDYEVPDETWFSERWEGIKVGTDSVSAVRKTGVSADTYERVGKAISTYPDDLKLHRNVAKIVKNRGTMVETGENIDWGTAEALAFGTLLDEGKMVRVSGQDAQRGTFSHRHAVVHDQEGKGTYTFLNHISDDQKRQLCAANSPLSEYGVLGFELGYSQEDPHALIIWEAQFGDFSNTAQVIFDQFLSSGETKWLRQSGLVCMLPHGYEGQGPEHSSCRIERFLLMSDEDPDSVPDLYEERRKQIQRCNWQVVNCSTPANLFHVLRRQVHRDFRKPLILVTPKSLLKMRQCVSQKEDFLEGTKFKRILREAEPEALTDDDKVRRVVWCSGKIYYELLNERQTKGIDDVAILRLEQISPFPFDKVAEEMAKYSNAELVWCQEEPKNMGCWVYVQDRFMTATRAINGHEIRPAYVGRETMAAPAEGYGNVHTKEQKKLVSKALSDEVTTWAHGRDTGSMARAP